MRTRLSAVLQIAALALLAVSTAALASPRDSLVVSTTWLAQHLKDDNLVLIHVGDKPGYDASHIEGARYVNYMTDLETHMTPGGLMLEMLPADQLHDQLAALGISDHSRIVVYYGKDWVSPSTRVLFTLDYAGLGDKVALLDGGMEAWVRDGHGVTSVAPPPPHAGKLAPLKTLSTVVDADYVLKHLKAPGVAIVDGRAAAFYDGVEAGGEPENPHRRGHIAGAHNVPFTSITDDHLMLRPAAELAEIFTKAGVKPDDTVIGYCHLGQQATAMLFAARTLGHPVLLYDGSFEDWTRHTDYPVELPAEPPAKKDHP